MATENKASVLYEDQPKVEKISQHIGCVYSGMGPDYRLSLYVSIGENNIVELLSSVLLWDDPIPMTLEVQLSL